MSPVKVPQLVWVCSPKGLPTKTLHTNSLPASSPLFAAVDLSAVAASFPRRLARVAGDGSACFGFQLAPLSRHI